MEASAEMRTALVDAARSTDPGLSPGARLCQAATRLLDVDGASLSLKHKGQIHGSFGASGRSTEAVEALQFLYGEGPCVDVIRTNREVFSPELAAEQRWPMFTPHALREGVAAAFALPVMLASACVGALDLYRHTPGSLTARDLDGGRLVAELATVAVLDMLTTPQTTELDEAWLQLGSLSGVEVSQATGMVMGQLDVGPVEALVRLRAHAYASSQSVSAAAWDIIERRLVLQPDPPTVRDRP